MLSKAPKADFLKKNRDTLGSVLRVLIVFTVAIATGIVIYKKKEISPYGSNDILSIDLWGQYFPMYRKFALDHGFSEAMYNWSGALGFNNWVQNAFYTRSIFLIPFGLVPLAKCITYIDIAALLRFGLGAAACQLYAEYKFKSKSPLIMVASVGYGLCSYATAFIMQFMWTDGLFLAPLVLLGLEKMMNGKSPLMYVIMLALTIYTNFYTGFGVCLFTGFYFIAEWFKREYTDENGKKLCGKANIKARLALFGRFSLYSVIGGLLTAFIILPTLKGLSITESANEGRFDFKQWYHTLAENISAMLPTTPASLEYGVANIAVGLFAFILIPLYFMNTEIKPKDKLLTGGFLGVLYAGLNYNPMDWLFNGFHFPNQLPGRWSFLFSFAIAIVASNGIAKRNGIKLTSIIASMIIAMFFTGYAKFGNPSQEKLDKLSYWNELIIVFAILMAFSIIFGYFSQYMDKQAEKLAKTAETEDKKLSEKEEKSAKLYKAKAGGLRFCAFATSLLLSVAMTEEICRNNVNVATSDNGGILVSDMDTFIKVSESLYKYGTKYDSGKNEFYRIEVNDGWTFNTSMIGDFKGIGYYGSTLNHEVYDLLRDMGNRIYANNVSTVYNNSSLFQNSLFGIKYIIDRGRYFESRSGKGYELVDTNPDCLVWENKTPFPIAFSASREILTAQITPDNVQAVNDQNDLLNKICGSETNVFEHIDPADFTNDNADIDTSNGIWMYHDFTRIDENLPVTVTWLYIVQDDMPIYLEHNFNGGQLTVNGNIFDLGSEKFRCIGSYAPGTELRIEYITDDIGRGSFGLDLYRFNMDKWNSIYDSVKANGLEVSSFKNTKIKGSLNASEAGLVMTSIPQDGGWTVYVDGKKTSNFKVLGTLIGFNVGAGNHDIEFKYHVPLFKAGFLLTLLALAALVLCLRIRKGGGIKFKKKEKVSENHEKADEAEKSNEKSSKKPENIKTAKDYEKELTRSKSYIVTHEYETVILRNVDNDLKIATIAKFGKDDPGDAKITENEKYCVVIGWGAIIYKLQPPFENYLSGLNTTQWKKYLVDENTWFEEIKEITAEYAILVAENGEEHKVEFDF